MEKLLKYIVSHIVSQTKDIQINTEDKNGVLFLKLKVNPDDMARIIGKKGRTIQSIRQIVRIKASLENSKAVVALEESA